MTRPSLGLIARAAIPASWVYALAIGVQNRRFDRGIGVRRLPVPVISVGNLSVGGTGKTPVVGAVVERLVARGARPCIAMRGYAPGGGESDEALLHRERFPGVAVVARADRFRGVSELMARQPGAVGCVVLDDGFQHRQIARDLDVVLVDVTRAPTGDRLLPAGRLREGMGSLRRAGVVVLTRCEQVSEERRAEVARDCRKFGVDVACARSVWRSELVWSAAGDQERGAGELGGMRVLLVSAIGNPEAFEAMARGLLGDAIGGSVRLRDHDPYGEASLARITREMRESACDAILTTEKDWVKLRRHAETLGVPVIRPRLDIEFVDGGDAFWARVESVGVASRSGTHV